MSGKDDMSVADTTWDVVVTLEVPNGAEVYEKKLKLLYSEDALGIEQYFRTVRLARMFLRSAGSKRTALLGAVYFCTSYKCSSAFGTHQSPKLPCTMVRPFGGAART